MDADEDCLIENYQRQSQEQDFHDDIAVKVSLARCWASESISELMQAVESVKHLIIHI